MSTQYNFYEHHDTIKGISADEQLWDQIIKEIAYFTARDIATDHNKKSVSRCVTKLTECDEYPHELTIWSGEEAPPRTYKVERGEK
jgi:hypothetical protein